MKLFQTKRWLPVAATFVVGLLSGTGIVLANHPWLCSGSTAYHYSPRSVGYASAVAQSSVVRSASSYTSAYSGSVSVWDSTIVSLFVSSTPKLRLYYGAYGQNGWLGLASLTSISSCHVNSANAKINDTYMRDTARYSQTAVNHVACQEVGHTFGLNHNRTQSDTCMNDTILTAGNQINQHDRDQLNSIYAHVPQ
ncbi:MAG: hypothetical protein HY231_05115 [Acidobacteria bacterium]|nr:hypothetical protein [Acidobacteriota bacterium]